jgi:hypothetical protein
MTSRHARGEPPTVALEFATQQRRTLGAGERLPQRLSFVEQLLELSKTMRLNKEPRYRAFQPR